MTHLLVSVVAAVLAATTFAACWVAAVERPDWLWAEAKAGNPWPLGPWGRR